jgi:hypothetical protein
MKPGSRPKRAAIPKKTARIIRYPIKPMTKEAL